MSNHDKKKITVGVYLRMNKAPKTALYCRTASPCADGIEKQQKMLQDYAAKDGHTDTVLYCDNGSNGLNFDRPSFKKLEKDIKNGDIKTVIVCDVSRISRNGIDMMKWIGKFKKSGGEFVSIQDGYSDEFTELEKDILKHLMKYKKTNRSKQNKIAIGS